MPRAGGSVCRVRVWSGQDADLAPGDRHIVLVGLMGAGKSIVGRALAVRLGRPVADSDRDLERATGLTAEEWRRQHGTRALHAREASILLEALSIHRPAVICAAASTMERPACRQALRTSAAIEVWLKAGPDTLAARFGGEVHRPRFGSDPRAVLVRQAARRDPLFAAMAAIIIDVDQLDPWAIVDQIEYALTTFHGSHSDGHSAQTARLPVADGRSTGRRR
jgi:shikimate kinase